MEKDTGKLDKMLKDRSKTHGDWGKQATLAQMLKACCEPPEGPALPDSQREALDMICVKLSRIVVGDPNNLDHWEDIAGYATLGGRGLLRPGEQTQASKQELGVQTQEWGSLMGPPRMCKPGSENPAQE